MTSIALMAAGVLSQPGSLFLAGGGDTPDAIVTSFLEEAGKDKPILVFGQVKENPGNAESSREWLIEHGAKCVILLDFDQITPLHRETTEKLLQTAGGIWIPGGDQNLLLDRWGEDWAGKAIREAVDRGASYYGTSAGAMLASETMIAGNGDLPGTTIFRKGLGLTSFVVESHMKERKRLPRLEWTLKQSGRTKAIGLSEGEWVKITNGVPIPKNGSPLIRN